jgi:2'-5' RNA ligase
VRLFVAMDIPEEVRAALRALVQRLRPACGAAKWTRIENAHITLKFIGEASLEHLQQIKSALASVGILAPIRMNFRGAGFFPNPKRPRVFWAGVEGGLELANLAERVSSTLEPLGLAKEKREFSPHITLAQCKVPADFQQLQRAISDAGSLEGLRAGPPVGSLAASLNFGDTVATEFHLYQSVLKPTGAEYTRLATYRFAEDGSQ